MPVPFAPEWQASRGAQHVRMINLAKQWVLRLLNHAGYRLLKKADHEALLAAAAAPRGALDAAATEQQPAAALAPDRASSHASAIPLALDLTGAALASDPQLMGFLQDAEDRYRLPPPLALALYRIAQYLAQAGIEGDIVDCGYGATATLAAIGSAFARCRDTIRRLVLFDASAIPLHRAETELELWGTERDIIAGAPARSRSYRPEPPSAELAATGYPVEKIAVRRYPREPIAQTEPVAFLGLTAESYPANRKAIATFLPKVSHGGVIAVAGNRTHDAVAEFLARERLHLLFMQVAADYRIAVKP